ncbi:MAG TPA: HupE/UreJ family protein [Gemmatimonas sp.]|nr:HupE/UreJ family protein [Gemmatimonas sp.]
MISTLARVAGQALRRPAALQRAALQRLARVALVAAALVALLPAVPFAHELPRDVVVRAFVKPERQTLRVLVRVPLEAMRDVEFATRGPGYLDLSRADGLLRDAAKLWIADGLTVFEDGARLAPPRIVATRASSPADGAFREYATALATVSGPSLPLDTDLPWKQVMLDVLLEYDITSDSAAVAVQPSFATLGVRTTSVVRYLPAQGAERTITFDGDPGLVSLDPGFFDAAWRFLRLGFTHILDGTDHLLFLLCLVVPFRSFRPLVALVTSFTIGHSITLVASALGHAPDALWFPPLVETLIALSIVYMACENMLGATLQRRWLFAFGFGLVHGFGFSFALRDSLQFAGGQLAASLAAFNVGVELGQIGVMAVAVPALVFLFKRVPERAGIILLSAFVAHTAWHWTTERAGVLREYHVEMPAMDALLLASAMRGLMLLIMIGGAGWALHVLLRRFITRPAVTTALCALLIAGGAAAMAPEPLVAQTTSAKRTPSKAAPSKALPAKVQVPQPAKPSRTTMAGIYTADQATQGREVFTGTCTGCHTPASHTGVVFTSKWLGRSVDDLFTYIRNTMPKIAPGSLSEDEYVWVTAYILKLNGMPAGSIDLVAEPSLMRAVRIDTLRARASRQ